MASMLLDGFVEAVQARMGEERPPIPQKPDQMEKWKTKVATEYIR